VCWGKAPESEWVEYRLNHCGHRAGMECRPKTPGTYRIVMIGFIRSVGQPNTKRKDDCGYPPHRPLATIPGDISNCTTKAWMALSRTGLRNIFDEVLAAQPDMILWILTPFDISTETSDRFHADTW